MSKKNKTEIVMIIDRSGSMQSMRSEAQNGINRFLSEQHDEGGKASLTLAQFDDQYEILFDGENIKKIDPEHTYELVPRGCTALLDAVGKTVNTVLDRQSKEKNPASNTICFVVTDGMENASHEFTRDGVKEVIKKAEGNGWDFVFLAANQDAFTEASAIGIHLATNYSPDTAMQSWTYASSLTSSYRSAGKDAKDVLRNKVVDRV